MLDFRSNDQIEAMKKNQHGKTFGLSAWQRKPLLVQKVVTKNEWRSSVHHFQGTILFTYGLDNQVKESEQIVLSLHDDEPPFKQLEKQVMNRDQFELVVIAEDVRKKAGFSVAILLEQDGGQKVKMVKVSTQ